MAKNVSDHIVERLAEWGVAHVFGYPGDGINGLMGALRRGDHGCRFIQARHEEMAAFMACAYAKFTEKPGVCMATSGPGAIHLLNGLYDAKLDHQPVVAIVGQAATTAIGSSYQQEVDLQSLFKDVASEYVHTATTPEQVTFLIDRAFRTALAERCPTCVIVPKDLQEQAAAEPPHAHDTAHSSAGYVAPTVLPNEAEVARAAEVLNAGERVAMLIGAGAKGAIDELLAVQDRLGAGVAKALLGRAVLPDDLPFMAGPIGLLGSKPSWDLMMGCDTLLMVGTSFPYAEFLPKPGKARGVQIDIDARQMAIRYPVEVGLVGDARRTLQALLPHLKRKQDRAWEQRVADGVVDWWRLMDERARVAAHPINPQHVFAELSPRLPERAIIVCDSGSAANWFARDLKMRRGMLASLSGGLATMGCGVPYAIGAKFAHPDRPVVALVGDGAMQMNGSSELLTIQKYWREWRDPRLVVLVLHNNDLNEVTWEMRAMAGDPRFDASQDLPDFDYADQARRAGLRGIRLEDPASVASAWDEALASREPVVLDALVDPDVPPLPPHITLKQAKSFASSIARGDSRSEGVIEQAIGNLFPSVAHRV